MSVPAIVNGSQAWPETAPPTVVTIGNFDGVHRGHRALLDRTRELAREHGARACAFTFHPAPRDVLRPDNPVQRIQRLEDRLELLLDAGMDHVIVEPFSKDYAQHDATWFARVVLHERLRVAAVVVGWDFRFGKGRGGTVDTLRQELNAPVEQIRALTLGDEVVSSSRIRQAIARGDLELATTLLDRPHRVVGRVVPGEQRGRGLGFPTANLEPLTPLTPANGVYAVRAHLPGGRTVRGVANLGDRPTFGDGATTLEIHLLDFDEDLYDQQIGVDFVQRLRDEQRFESSEQLIAQIRTDVRAARDALDLR